MKRLLLLLFVSSVTVSVVADDYSGTLPVVFIDTKDGQPIDSKSEYVEATFYLDALGIDGIESLGDKEHALSLQIRGRGNYTWQSFDKKPYRLKFDKKQSILGMKKNKHFALLAHADDEMGFLRNAVGFEIGRKMGFRFTPEQHPVEAVLNGQYIGLYFLTETIRVDENRLDITEQLDEETDADKIKSGWLVELDNYDDDSQIRYDVSNYNLNFFKVTYHTPEVLSDVQYNWLHDEFERILNTIYDTDKTEPKWEQYIDIDGLARFYIVIEVIDHLEAFLGSCYLYKDKADDKWMFGPLWDLGHAFDEGHPQNKFIYESTWFPPSIIDEIVKFPKFQDKIREHWPDFYQNIYPSLHRFIDDYSRSISLAAKQNYQVWPQYGNEDVMARAEKVKSMLDNKVAFLQSQWSQQEVGIIDIDASSNRSASEELYDLSGQKQSAKPNKPGIYILRTKSKNGMVRSRKVIY